MKNLFKKLPGSKIELEVALDQNEFKAYWDAAYEKALADVHLKGFRPGTAPKELAEKAVNKDEVFEIAARSAVRFSLDEAVKDNEWTLIDTPKIDLMESPDLSLKYKAELTVFPEAELGNYKKIAKKVLTEKKAIKIEPTEVEKSLEWLQKSRAKVTRVNRPARPGDLMDIDLESNVDSFKGEKFVLSEGRFMPGFESQLENHQAGEKMEFSLKAPEDYWNEKLRGQNLTFKVKINGVFERELPVLDDNFAQGLGSAFKKVDDLRRSISDGLRQEKEAKENERLKIKMIDEIIKSSKLDIPEVMVEKTLANMVEDYKSMTRGVAGKNDEEIKSQLRERAKNNVAGNLAIYKIAQAEHLEPTKEEVEAEAKIKNLDFEKFYDYIYGIVLNQKVLNFLTTQ